MSPLPSGIDPSEFWLGLSQTTGCGEAPPSGEAAAASAQKRVVPNTIANVLNNKTINTRFSMTAPFVNAGSRKPLSPK